MQHKGKRRDFGLGPAHDITLADARASAAEIRRMVRAGLDPVKERGLQRKAGPTFEIVARRCYEAMRGGWKDQRHASWISSFENHVFPSLGAKRVDEIDTSAVLGVLEPIWLTIPDTARRLFQRIGAVLDYAHVKGWIAEEVSLRSVRRGLPRQTNQTQHRIAMPYKQIPAFMDKLLALPPSAGRDALKLTILTAVRSNETRFATWREFDLEAGIWSIPAIRMKMKEPHVVPLSRAALTLLKRLHADAVDDLEGTRNERASAMASRPLFSAARGKPISDMTMTKVLRDMKIAGVTVHGFRSSFTDWAAEQTDTPKEIADKALAHKVPNAVEAAYRRTDFFDKRRALMSLWAAFVMRTCDQSFAKLAA
jgi:integrase